MNTAMTDFGAAYSRLSANVRGALWMLASAVTFTLMTSLIKFLGDDYSPALQTTSATVRNLVDVMPTGVGRQVRETVRFRPPFVVLLPLAIYQ